jgi:hypothetical protein
MPMNYEGVVETTGGTFRISLVTSSMLAIREDGVDGVVDFINLDEIERALWAPETLVSMLLSWIYEMRRSHEVISLRLALPGP